MKNGSPRALALFERIMQDRMVYPESRIDTVYNAVLSHRIKLAVLESCGRLLEADLESQVTVGVAETVFDYRSKEWFGPAIRAPEPPPWEDGTDKVLAFVLRVGERTKAGRHVPDALLAAIERTAAEIREILEIRSR